MATLSLLLLHLILRPRPRPVKIPIKDRHVFITGGSSGIGLAMAHQAASQAARVSILARGRDKLEEAQRAIRLATGIDVAVFSADALVCNQGVFVPSELEKQEMGMAESLQQEVIADNIHVSQIFPPDTETPGLAEEEKKRPPLTSIIAASSGAMKADEVAKKALDGIKSGSFFVPCNFEGILLVVATAGLSPQRSLLMAFVEVIAAGIARIVALCFQWIWYGTIEKWHAHKK
ncbi:hypothetical protein RHGRI_030160 [Rhododendron griersonianum]|uniref:Uncharacterized protein n=1 Tax=Rhododendron griersonianum TaxID=479676 RepID=A0AAV6IP34_9ERIC|nr:hypothetical protein RHGRI_030160 [Rhododendron griersonianum]